MRTDGVRGLMAYSIDLCSHQNRSVAEDGAQEVVDI